MCYFTFGQKWEFDGHVIDSNIQYIIKSRNRYMLASLEENLEKKMTLTWYGSLVHSDA